MKNGQQITVLVTVVMVILCIFTIILWYRGETPELEYTMTEYVVRSGDTLWEIWQENYSQYYNYAEFLSNFKQDNDREQSGIIAGQTILLRDIVKEE